MSLTEIAAWLVANGPISIGINANMMQVRQRSSCTNSPYCFTYISISTCCENLFIYHDAALFGERFSIILWTCMFDYLLTILL